MVIGPPRELERPRPNTQSGAHYRGGRVKYRVKAAYVTITNVFGTRPRMRSINFKRKRGMEKLHLTYRYVDNQKQAYTSCYG